jgi:hypothetical protein
MGNVFVQREYKVNKQYCMSIKESKSICIFSNRVKISFLSDIKG